MTMHVHKRQCHTSFFNTEQHNTLPWPSLSTNLNPIEHLWDRIDQDIRNHVRKPRTIQELTDAVQNAWNSGMLSIKWTFGV